MSTDQRLIRTDTGHDDTSAVGMNAARLGPAAIQLFVGQLLYIVITQFHAGGDANDHRSIFTTYAGSWDWKGVHVFQFGAAALIVSGLVSLQAALPTRSRTGASAARLGAVFAVVSLALYGVLQAVDGIGNKQVDYAWEHASAADEPARFASAESMRWLEWGLSSYHAYALAVALLAFAAAMAHVVPRVVTVLTGLSGLAYLAQGWVAGSDGFSAAHSTLIVASWVLSVAWMAWLVAIARRAPLAGR